MELKVLLPDRNICVVTIHRSDNADIVYKVGFTRHFFSERNQPFRNGFCQQVERGQSKAVKSRTCLHYMFTSFKFSFVSALHAAVTGVPTRPCNTNCLFYIGDQKMHADMFFSGSCVEIIFRLFSLRTEKNLWRKCQSSEETSVPVEIQI